jgi:hypothetical protein
LKIACVGVYYNENSGYLIVPRGIHEKTHIRIGIEPIVKLDPQSAFREIGESIITSLRISDEFRHVSERQIAIITEYRTRMISDVVTGKVDVRDVVIPDFDAEETAEVEDEDDVGEADELVDGEGEENAYE